MRILTNLGAPVTGYPITYLAQGKQHVAVSVGNSMASSSINRLAEELYPGNASNVFVLLEKTQREAMAQRRKTKRPGERLP